MIKWLSDEVIAADKTSALQKDTPVFNIEEDLVQYLPFTEHAAGYNSDIFTMRPERYITIHKYQ